MKIFFLFAHSILISALNKNNKTDFAIVSREALDIAAKLSEVWATSQAIDKVVSQLKSTSYNSAIKFKDFIKEENTTRGVASFNPDTSTTESAKSLANKGITIVVTNEEDKRNIAIQKRIFTLTPSELILAYKQANKISERLPFKDIQLSELVILYLSKPNQYDHICKDTTGYEEVEKT